MATFPRYRLHPRGKSRHILVAWDLGKRKLGGSVWLVSPSETEEPGVEATLVTAGTIFTVDPPMGWAPEVAAAQAISATRNWVVQAGLRDLWPQHIQVCEWPVKYRDCTAYHDDIEKLQKVGKALGAMRARWAPRKWKGSVPKQVHHRRIAAQLTPMENASLRDRGHDAWDAVGIGLYAVGRGNRGISR